MWDVAASVAGGIGIVVTNYFTNRIQNRAMMRVDHQADRRLDPLIDNCIDKIADLIVRCCSIVGRCFTFLVSCLCCCSSQPRNYTPGGELDVESQPGAPELHELVRHEGEQPDDQIEGH